MTVRGPLHAIVLAAGEGTRMRSERPKPLHRLCGRPMVLHVLDALAELELDRVVVVVGHGAEWVTKTLADQAPDGLKIEFVEQVVQRGTGDAAAVALTGLPEDDEDADVVVLPGRHPIAPTGHARCVGAPAPGHRRRRDAADRGGRHAGRVRAGRSGRGDEQVVRIVEDVDATDEERAIHEVNTSIYCFRRALLAPALRRLSPSNAQGEYYLTDVIEVLSAAGYAVRSMVIDDPVETAGVNDRAQLAAAEAEVRDRINERWMRRGVTMWDPERTYVDTTVELVTGRRAVARGGASGQVHRRDGGRDRAGHDPHRYRGRGVERDPILDVRAGPDRLGRPRRALRGARSWVRRGGRRDGGALRVASRPARPRGARLAAERARLARGSVRPWS